jgi:hypothetical protein
MRSASCSTAVDIPAPTDLEQLCAAVGRDGLEWCVLGDGHLLWEAVHGT